MENYTAEELQAALRPIASLISKSEKAQQKLAKGSWQHAMLSDNLKALNFASALMNSEIQAEVQIPSDDLPAARKSLDLMIDRTEKAMAKVSPGTAQFSLLQNRLRALKIADELIKQELDKG